MQSVGFGCSSCHRGMRLLLLELAIASALAACSTSEGSGGADASTDRSPGALLGAACRTHADCGGGICLAPGQTILEPCGGPPPYVQCGPVQDCSSFDAGADVDAGDLVCQPAACDGALCLPRCKVDGDCPLAAIA